MLEVQNEHQLEEGERKLIFAVTKVDLSNNDQLELSKGGCSALRNR